MKKTMMGLAIGVAFAVLAVNGQASEAGLEACVQAVKKAQAGELLKLEKLSAAGKASYEIEVRDANHGEFEFICDAAGNITEKETEVADPNSQAFKKNVKITEEDAAAVALKASPGKIEEVEYEVEDDGSSSYEFDIVSDKGTETKVEVDAATGKIIETAVEEWEIGEESDEKR